MTAFQPTQKPPTSKTSNPYIGTPGASPRDQAAAGFAAIAQGRANPTDTFQPLIDSIKADVPAPGLPASDSPGTSAVPSASGGSVPVGAGGSKLERQAASLVQKYLGVNYVWGGTTPKGFDCSGLLQYVWRSLGVNIPRTTYDQFKAGQAVNPSNLKPGDAVFFTGSDPMNGLPGHVGMYIGDGKFIEAPHTGAQVRISTLNGRTDFVGARRYG